MIFTKLSWVFELEDPWKDVLEKMSFIVSVSSTFLVIHTLCE